MKQIKNYQNKNVLVLGAGLSGIYGSALLYKLNAHVTLIDPKPACDFSQKSQKIFKKLILRGIKIQLGINQKNFAKNNLNQYDLLVKSPGIPYENPIVSKFQKLHIPITVEVEIASEVNPGHLICITGSNGKTTTTMLITRMLNAKYQSFFNRVSNNGKKHLQLKFADKNQINAADYKINWNRPINSLIKQTSTLHPFTLPYALDAGNIGISASRTAQKMNSVDTMVMEISSFMLASITKLHPHIAVITNIYSNHLDWHKTRANYVHDKMNITKNQDSNDYFVMNFNTKEWRDLSKRSKAKVIPYCTNGYTEEGAYEKNGKLYFRGHYVMNAKDIKIHGQYNVENTLAAIAVAKINHVPNKDIQHVMKTFSGASNRNQYVTAINHRIFFNDSKSTDVESTQAAVNSFKQPEILLLGGLDRGYTMKTFKKLIPNLKKHVRGVVTFGQTNQLMAHLAKASNIKYISIVKTIDQAVLAAYKMSQPNNVILLSPANASWDQYPNFEVRGKAYRKAIENLNN